MCALYGSELFPTSIIIIFLTIGFLLCLHFTFVRRGRETIIVWIALIACGFAVGYRYYETLQAHKNLETFRRLLGYLDQKSNGDSVNSWVGSVTSFVEKYPDKVMMVVRIESIFDAKGEKLFDAGSGSRIKVYVFIKNPFRQWKYGDKFTARSPIKEFRDYRNPAPPFHQDIKRANLWRGTYGYVFMNDDSEVVLLGESPSFYLKFLQWIDTRRQNFSDYVDNRIGYPESAFLKALTVGYRKFIDPVWNELTNKAAVQHLLAISGLHLASVAFLTFLVFRCVLRNLWPEVFLIIPEPILSTFLSIPVVFCYSFLTGLAVPTQRAFLFAVFLFCGSFMFRKIDFLTIFSMVASIILLCDISLLYSPSFVLSFAAVGSIFWVALALRPASDFEAGSQPKFSGSRIGEFFLKIRKVLFETLRVSLCAQVVLCPFLLYFFGRFSWAGVAANMVLVPFVSLLVLPACLLLLGGFLISPYISDLFVWLLKGMIALMLKMIEFFGSWDGLVFWGQPLTLSGVLAKLYILLYLIVLALVVRTIRQRSLNPAVKLVLVLSVALLYQGVVVLLERGASPNLEALVLDVGDGSSTFIAFPNGKTAIMDGGGITGSSFDIGRQIVIPAIMASGFRHLDDVVLSHYHYDHAKGLEFALRSFPVGRFMEPLCPPEDEIADLSDIAKARKIQVIPFHRLAEVFENSEYGGVDVQVIHPSVQRSARTFCRDLNGSSTVLRLSYGSTVLVIPSDIGKAELRELLPNISKKGDEVFVLVAPHHGRCGSFEAGLFDMISPDVVIISAKRKNRVPCPGLVQWCKERGVHCFTTWDYGAIRLKSDRLGWTIYGTNDDGTSRLLGRVGRNQAGKGEAL